MAKTPLTITAIDVSGGTGQPPTKGAPFEMMINPSEFSHQRSICYSRRKTLGQTSNPLKFATVNPDTISFSVVFDGTGVVTTKSGETIEVADQISSLSKVIFNFDSEAHEPNHLRVSWINLVFDCRLQTFNTQYTLFKSSGAPLRAKVELALAGFETTEQAQKKQNKSSPDLSHTVQVVEGDTLPLLCLRIYGDARYYPEVAAFNRLDGFRRLTPGTHLHFPPLR